MYRYRLDPQEGPTVWLDIEEVETAEGLRVTLKTGTNPENPMKEVTLNEHETRRAIRHISKHMEI